MGEPNILKMKAKKDVKGLIKALTDEDKYVRKQAAWALGQMGESAVERLIRALKDEEEAVRSRVAEALGKIGDARAVEPLIQALKDKDRVVRWRAAEALGEMEWEPENDIEKAWYLVAKREWRELIEVGEPAVEPLIQALKDKDRFVRQDVAKVLVELGNTASKAILSMPDWKRQVECLWVLAKIKKNPELIPDIVSYLFASPCLYLSENLHQAKDSLWTLCPYSNLSKEIISLIITASSFGIIEVWGKEPGHHRHDKPSYDDAIEATKQFCALNNPITTNVLYMISQKKDITVELEWEDCDFSGTTPYKLLFAKQRGIAAEELKRRGFTGYDSSVYFKK
jgi:3-methyladenine DNA glycosylase AlkC